MGGLRKVLILRQDIRGSGTSFSSYSEVMSHNSNDPNAKLYSGLGSLETVRNRADGRFHFLLKFPELDPDKGIKWRQTDNPLHVTCKL